MKAADTRPRWPLDERYRCASTAEAERPPNICSITLATLRSRSVAEKASIARAIEAKVWPLVVAGRVRPVVFQTFPLAQAAAAHALMETSSHIGKIVLTLEVGQTR